MLEVKGVMIEEQEALVSQVNDQEHAIIWQHEGGNEVFLWAFQNASTLNEGHVETSRKKVDVYQ